MGCGLPSAQRYVCSTPLVLAVQATATVVSLPLEVGGQSVPVWTSMEMEYRYPHFQRLPLPYVTYQTKYPQTKLPLAIRVQ